MTKKKPADLNRLAFEIMREATSEDKPTPEEEALTEARRKGGKRGGAARASKLTPEQRSEIAKRAAKARWGTQGEH